MKQTMNRRRFLTLSGASLATAMSQPLWANLPTAADDYKALVCIFLHGGNDSHNMLIPTGEGERGYAPYAKARRHLAVANTALNFKTPYNDSKIEDVYLSGHYPIAGSSVGINAVMPELANLVASGQATTILNSGALAMPVSREQLKKDKHKLPLFLFAHNHQQRIAQTGRPHDLNSPGWAGLLSDLTEYHKGLAFNVSYSGNNRLQQGPNSSPLILQPGKIPKVAGIDGDPKSRVLKERKELLNAMLHSNKDMSAWHGMYASRVDQALTEFNQIRQVWDNVDIQYQQQTMAGNPLFSIPKNTYSFDTDIKGRLMQQLEAVAKMIQLNANKHLKGNSSQRQFYMVKLTGFDTHDDQVQRHPILLRELSLAIESFQLALQEKGLSKQVKTFTTSDFGRTLSINGDGTDHAWGGHQWVIGDQFDQATLGTLPKYALNGDDDFGDKGRFIPSTSQDQVYASLCKWMGVKDSELPTLFPHLQQFSRNSTINSALFETLYS